MRFTAIDCEMTGLSCERDRIIEIGAVTYVDGVAVAEFSSFVNADVLEIPERIVALTGIRDEMIRNAPREREVFFSLLEFLRGERVLLGHNIVFDYGFLKVAAERYDQPFDFLSIDTLWLARMLLKELPTKKLSSLCEYFHIDTARSHRAVDDAVAAAQLYFRLQETSRELPSEGLFEPRETEFKRPKREPATKRQVVQLKALMELHQIEFQPDYATMTKSEASRMIDYIKAGKVTAFARMRIPTET